MKKLKTPAYVNLANLHKLSGLLAILYVVQVIVVALISHADIFSITSNYLTSDQLLSIGAGKTIKSIGIHHIYDVNLLYIIVILLTFSIVVRLILLTTYRPDYELDLKKGVNKARWVEYAVSTSLILVILGLLSGIDDLATLLLIIGDTVLVSILVLVVELSQTKNTQLYKWLYPLACGVGLLPWLVFIIYDIGTNVLGGTSLPAFVYGLSVTILILLIARFVSLYFEMTKFKLWAESLYAEGVFVVLGFVMISLVSWEVVAGALH